MKTVTLQEFHDALRAQEVPHDHLAFKCAVCGTVQSAHDLIQAGAGDTFQDVEGFLGYACIGRFTDAGPHRKEDAPGKGCDWTLGGLFQLHEYEVISEAGNICPRFAPATPAEAQAHMALNTP